MILHYCITYYIKPYYVMLCYDTVYHILLYLPTLRRRVRRREGVSHHAAEEPAVPAHRLLVRAPGTLVYYDVLWHTTVSYIISYYSRL